MKQTLKDGRAVFHRTELALAAHGWRIRRGIRLPDFIGIGSPQSASTWLAHNLDQHPEVSISSKKETRFFSAHLDRGLKWYSNHFDAKPGRLVGEFTPSYGRLPLDRIQLIRGLAPDVRLLLTLRDPVDRAWAGARRTMTKLARHWSCSIDDIPKHEWLKYFDLEGEYHKEVLGRTGNFVSHLKPGEYSRILDNWLSVFPEEQLLCVFYDDVKADPLSVLKRIFVHLGVETEIDPSLFALERINANRQRDMPQWAADRLCEIYGPEIERLRQRFGRELPSWGVTGTARSGGL